MTEHQWRNEVIKAFNGKCAICPSFGTQCHHIITRGSEPRLKKEPLNGALLCHTCHRNLHTYGSQILLESLAVFYPKRLIGLMKLAPGNRLFNYPIIHDLLDGYVEDESVNVNSLVL